MGSTLFTPSRLDRLSLKSRIVMALLKRSRAIGNLPSRAMIPMGERSTS